MRLPVSPACIVATTDGTNEVAFSLKVPGTYGLGSNNETAGNPLDGYIYPYAHGRFIDRVEVWTDNGAAGDMIVDLCIKDTDGNIPAALRPAFPDYPILHKFYDDSITTSSANKKGFYLIPSNIEVIRPPLGGPQFLPAGVYFNGTYKSSASSKIVRINIWWSSLITAPSSAPAFVIAQDGSFLLKEDGEKLKKERA